MPRPGPRRPSFTLRLSEEGRAEIDRLAVTEGLVKADGQPNTSAMVRRLLAEAVAARKR